MHGPMIPSLNEREKQRATCSKYSYIFGLQAKRNSARPVSVEFLVAEPVTTLEAKRRGSRICCIAFGTPLQLQLEDLTLVGFLKDLTSLRRITVAKIFVVDVPFGRRLGATPVFSRDFFARDFQRSAGFVQSVFACLCVCAREIRMMASDQIPPGVDLMLSPATPAPQVGQQCQAAVKKLLAFFLRFAFLFLFKPRRE